MTRPLPQVLKGVRHLSLEAGPGCNLAAEHDRCPSRVRERFPSKQFGPLSVDDMVLAIDDAVALGFDGFVGFHYYNEPLLYVDTIREVVSRSAYHRYVLWTNGELLSPDFASNDILELFEWVVISDYYPEQNASRLAELQAAFPGTRFETFVAGFDARLDNYEAPAAGLVTCWRQRVEIPVDYYGNVHLCCQDWMGTVAIGNIKERPLREVLTDPAYLGTVAALCEGSAVVPEICHRCKNSIGHELYLEVCAGFIEPAPFPPVDAE